MPDNPYHFQLLQALPRLLSLYDQDRTSKSYGMGDRFFWAWGLIDFGNATFQGAASGLARLWTNDLWRYPTSQKIFLNRINALFQGASKLMRKDGSLEEAFPFEGSFCVTALVAFDLLCTLDILDRQIDSSTKSSWQRIVQPLMTYILKSDETHGLISNHLATAVAALLRWHKLTGDPHAEEKSQLLLQRILDHQSSEGWFKEYEGADPGYQSLCTYYLADVHEQRPDWGILEPLRKSIQFLWHFAHPDGSFGGLYGSRCTRFYNPAGIEALADEISEALALADYMAQSIQQNKVVTLSCMDEPNLIPWFNAYAWAAVLYEKRRQKKEAPSLVPCMQKQSRRISFKQAGLLIDQGPDHYSIINTHKGGVVYHFQDSDLSRCDVGVVVKNGKGALASTQTFASENQVQWLDDSTLTIQSSLRPMPKRMPKPIEFLALRLMCMSMFRFRVPREWVKQMLVKLLITGKKALSGKNIRTITLGPNLSITDQSELPSGYQKISMPGPFVAIHMASQGYWQVQDEGKHDTKI